MPKELQAIPSWMLWKYVERDGKKTKPPFQINGDTADSTDPRTWSTFAEAMDAYYGGGFDGVGFSLEGSGYVGIDLDHIMDEAGAIKRSVLDIVEKLGSYTEMTPSGEGLHIWIRGSKPEGSRCKVSNFDGQGTDIEIYDSGRYFTMTGECGRIREINDRQEVLEAVLEEITPKRAVPAKMPEVKLSLDDNEIIEIAKRSKNGATITQLYDHGHINEDKSSDDLALLNHLAFYASSEEQLERLFASSACFRPDRWQDNTGGLTYGERTLHKAWSSRTGSYSGRQTTVTPFCVEDLATDPGQVSTGETVEEKATETMSREDKPVVDASADEQEAANVRFVSELTPIIKSRCVWLRGKGVFGLLSEQYGLVYFRDTKFAAQINLEYDAQFKRKTWSPVANLLIRENQVDRVASRIDYFISEPSIAILKNEAKVLIPWEPFPVPSRDGIDNYHDIISDYQEHFKELDAFITVLASTAFASNLKKAYLWIQAFSDWGKGFLMSVLEDMGMALVMEQGEVDKALAGSPVGLEADAFLRILCVVFDEFSSVNSNVKRLDGDININEKFKPRATVRFPLKLYLSMDDVPSMAGTGVESQFANRFSYLSYGDYSTATPINRREVFIREGQDSYFRAVSHFVGTKVNELIEGYRAMGRDAAAKKADEAITAWHADHAIVGELGGREEYLFEFCESLITECGRDTPWRNQYVRHHDGRTYILKCSDAFTELAINKFGDKGKAQAYKTSEIVRILQAGSDKPKRHRLPINSLEERRQVRAVEIHPDWRSLFINKHGLSDAANDEEAGDAQEIA